MEAAAVHRTLLSLVELLHSCLYHHADTTYKQSQYKVNAASLYIIFGLTILSEEAKSVYIIYVMYACMAFRLIFGFCFYKQQTEKSKVSLELYVFNRLVSELHFTMDKYW